MMERSRAKDLAQSKTSSRLVSGPPSVAGGVSTKENATELRQTSLSRSFFDDENGSSSLDGALYKILEYLTPSDFYTLGALTGSRFWKRFLFENPHSEYLFSPPEQPKISNARKHLKNLYYFRRWVERIQLGTKKCGKRNRKRSKLVQDQQNEGWQSLNRIGVFSPQEEDYILTNDTNGYFGVCFFRSGVLGVWGDYSGMFLTPHVDRIFSSQKISDSAPDAQVQLCPIEAMQCKTNRKGGEDKVEKETSKNPSSVPPTTHDRKTMGKDGYLFADSYQVMAVLADCKPYVFLGFASGTIHSVHSRPYYTDQPSSLPSKDPTATKSGKTIEYWHVSECRYHCKRGEISSLTSVADHHIVSSSTRVNAIQSEILIHWNALKDGNLQRISRIKIVNEHFTTRLDGTWDSSPLSMASSIYLPEWNGPVLSIGAQGQSLAHLGLWSNEENSDGNNTMSPHLGSENNLDNPPRLFEPSTTFHDLALRKEYLIYRANRTRDPRSHHFVFLKYFQKTKLIIGTSKGDVLRIEMEKPNVCVEGENLNVIFNCCTGGMVEVVELVGNKRPIMITGGGYDGRIQFWDWESFNSLVSLRIHPGQQALVAEASLAARSRGTSTAIPIAHHRYSPVVSTFFCHERSSLISFCRDGHIHEWRVEEEAKKSKMSKSMRQIPSPRA